MMQSAGPVFAVAWHSSGATISPYSKERLLALSQIRVAQRRTLVACSAAAIHSPAGNGSSPPGFPGQPLREPTPQLQELEIERR